MQVTLKETERIDDLQLKGLKLIQDKTGFCFGIDAVLLANFAKVKNNAKVGGGILYNNISPKIKGTTVFQGNKAFYFGSDSFSYPSHLYL